MRRASVRLPRLTGRKRLVALGGAVVILAGAGGAWARSRSAAEDTGTTGLQVAATVGTIRQTVSATGTIAPASRADLSFAVSGTVTSVPVEVGDKVAKGATLATVDDSDLQTAVGLAQASVDAAQDQVDSSSGSSATQVASAKAQLASAKSDLAEAKTALGQATLESPIAGTVASVSIATGDTVSSSSGSGSGSGSDGGGNGSGSGGSDSGSGSGSGSGDSTAQIVVISTTSWIVNATVGSADLASVKKGLQAEITPTGSNTKVFGTVKSVGVMASTASGSTATFPVTIAVTGSPAGLYAGGSASVSVIVKQLNDVLTVPTAAITSQNGKTFVKLVKGGKEVSTEVTVGTAYGAQTQILKGLKEGDVVVLTLARVGGGGSGRTGQQGGNDRNGNGGFGGFPEGGGGPQNDSGGPIIEKVGP